MNKEISTKKDINKLNFMTNLWCLLIQIYDVSTTIVKNNI